MMEERFLEQSEALTETLRDNGVSACSKQAIPSKDLEPHEYKTLHCEGCGEDLAEFRLKKGRTLCVYCQEAKETARKR